MLEVASVCAGHLKRFVFDSKCELRALVRNEIVHLLGKSRRTKHTLVSNFKISLAFGLGFIYVILR